MARVDVMLLAGSVLIVLVLLGLAYRSPLSFSPTAAHKAAPADRRRRALEEWRKDAKAIERAYRAWPAGAHLRRANGGDMGRRHRIAPRSLTSGEQRVLASFLAGRLPAGRLHDELAQAREAPAAAGVVGAAKLRAA
jgi:hypothetical protein